MGSLSLCKVSIRFSEVIQRVPMVSNSLTKVLKGASRFSKDCSGPGGFYLGSEEVSSGTIRFNKVTHGTTRF